jgi:hypothetical protein
MVISDNYVLSNEIAQKGNIHIANFSMFQNLCEERNIRGAIEKYGNCTFVNSRSIDVPNNFRKIMQSEEMTDLKNCVLLSYVTSYFQTSKKDFTSLPEVKRVFKVAGKEFAELTPDFADILKNKVVTNVDKKDYEECEKDSLILGSIKLSKNNYIVWY